MGDGGQDYPAEPSGHLAEVDGWEPPDMPERFAAALRGDGTEVEARTWPGTEPSFAEVDVAAYAPGQATDAWSATVTFLRRDLGRSS